MLAGVITSVAISAMRTVEMDARPFRHLQVGVWAGGSLFMQPNWFLQ